MPIGTLQALRQYRRLAFQELFERQAKDLVELRGGPVGRVARHLHPQIGHQVPQGAADPMWIVVLLQVGTPGSDRLGTPLLPPTPDRVEGPVGLSQDLILRPLLQIHLALEGDPLSACDFPGVGPKIGGQRVGVEQLQQRAVQLRIRPGLVLQDSERRLRSREERCADWHSRSVPSSTLPRRRSRAPPAGLLAPSRRPTRASGPPPVLPPLSMRSHGPWTTPRDRANPRRHGSMSLLPHRRLDL